MHFGSICIFGVYGTDIFNIGFRLADHYANSPHIVTSGPITGSVTPRSLNQIVSNYK